MATHSSILAWKIPWTEEPGGLQSMRLQRVGQGPHWPCPPACPQVPLWPTHVQGSVGALGQRPQCPTEKESRVSVTQETATVLSEQAITLRPLDAEALAWPWASE